jgi:RNA polymerase sigma factor (sigma-70 family)
MASAEAVIGRDLRRLFDGGGIAGLTEAQLLDRIARREESADAAFEAIILRHGPAVLACCRRVLGGYAAAEDALQATFLVLFRRAGSIGVAESLAPWLLHVARMAALKSREGELRRRARERRAARPEAILCETDAPEVGLLVRGEVDRLPGKYRGPVRLCYFEGQTHDGAAAALGWPVGTVRGRLSRAREMLRTRLARRGLAVSPMALAAALAGGGDARAEISRALVDATLTSTSRGGVVKPAVAAIATAVAHGLAAKAAIKVATVILAFASLLSAGAGLAAMAARGEASPRAQDPPREKTAPGARAIALDRYGDPLPEGAIARLGAMRFRHNYFGGNWSTVRGVAYAPDGRSLVTVGAGEARVWDIVSEHLIRTIDADLGALSPDGKTLFAEKSTERFSGGSKPGMVQAVDLSTGRELRQIVIAPVEPVKLMAVSLDGKSIAVLIAKHQTLHGPLPPATIVVYDAATFAERRRIALTDQYVNELSFSADGRLLAVAALDGEGPEINRRPKASSVRLYDATTGDLVRRFSIEALGVGAVAFSPDGKTLAVGAGDSTIRLFDVATGRERLPRLVRDARVVQPKMGPGAIEDRQWPRAAGCLAFSADGSLLASGPGWGGSQYLLNDWPPITLWDVAAAREIRRFGGHPYQICALAFSPDGKRLASSGGEPVARLWDVATGREVEHRVGHYSGIHAMAVSAADGTVFTRGNDDGLVIHWGPADGRAIETLALPPQRYFGLAVSPDGRTLAIGYNDGPNSGSILWKVAEHKELRRIKNTGGGQPVFSPDGRALSLGMWVYDVATGRRVDAFPRNTAEETWFTADGRRLISVEYDGARIWDFQAGTEIGRPIQAELKGWFNAAVSPDGRLVATGNIGKEGRLAHDEPSPDPAIRVWEMASGKQVAKLVGHVCQSNNLIFSPDSRHVASVSGKYGGERDAGLRVWEISSERQLRRFAYYPEGANSVAYLPNGRAIVTASAVDGMGIVWDVSDLADRRPAEVPDAKELEALWNDLASDDAPRGYRASWALSVEAALPLLRDRLRPLNSKTLTNGPEVLRTLRAIAALERIGSAQAQEVLKELTRGDSTASVTQDATASMLRLSRRKRGE